MCAALVGVVRAVPAAVLWRGAALGVPASRACTTLLVSAAVAVISRAVSVAPRWTLCGQLKVVRVASIALFGLTTVAIVLFADTSLAIPRILIRLGGVGSFAFSFTRRRAAECVDVVAFTACFARALSTLPQAITFVSRYHGARTPAISTHKPHAGGQVRGTTNVLDVVPSIRIVEEALRTSRLADLVVVLLRVAAFLVTVRRHDPRSRC